MKNLLLLFLLFPVLLISQISDYELEFNSATLEYVEMPNTSSVIANKIAFSISGWVNPQSNSTHGGIMGFRNNVDADFYLLQLQNTNNIEARFRGSSGVSYDIVAANILDFNQWQHLAFTYDGSYIRLFKDGALVDSSVANGIIGQNTLPLQLGKLDWQTTGFYLNGRLDEIRLWDVALSQTEINNWMCIPLDLTHPNYSNLMGYWQLNEGIGITATDLSVNGNNGTLTNNPIWQNSTTCLGNTSQVLKTYVPDDNFEQALINLGYDNVLDDSVLTSNINTVVNLDVSNQFISDLTGIEDFTALTTLDCSYNQLTSLDVSANTALTDLNCDNNQLTSLDANTLSISLEYLQCSYNQLSILDVNVNTALIYLHSSDNQLTSLDISQNTNLNDLRCQENQITTLDLSNNTALTDLDCSYNQLTSLNVSNNPNLTIILCGDNQIISLDVSNNPNLWELECYNNLLTNLDLRNGNNNWIGGWFSCYLNPYLTCINVDDSVWAANNWTVSNGNIDAQHYFSNNCPPPTSIEEYTDNRELLKITDLLGRDNKGTKNKTLFYIYNDGTVEKRVIIE